MSEFDTSAISAHLRQAIKDGDLVVQNITQATTSMREVNDDRGTVQATMSVFSLIICAVGLLGACFNFPKFALALAVLAFPGKCKISVWKKSKSLFFF